MEALRQIDAWPASNAAAGVVLPDGAVSTRGDPSRVFRWASVSKLVTALAALVAVEEGTVALDEPAGPPGATVRHLLAHASGLPPEKGAPVSRVGVRRVYSNWGFDALGELVAERAGMTFGAYAAEAVLRPLGTASADFSGRPAAGVNGSLSDLLLLASELREPRLVAAETLAEATTVAFPGLAGVLPGFGRQEPNDWGLGFELRDGKSPHWTGARNSPATFGHFGQSGGFLWIDPVAGVALAALSDRDFGAWAAEAWPRLADAVLAEAPQGV